MTEPKRGRRPVPRRPPSYGATSVAAPPSVTEDDLRVLADEAGIQLLSNADLARHAAEASEALRRYALVYRMDRARVSPAKVREWAEALQQWAADGLLLLGGTIDNDWDEHESSNHDTVAHQLLRFEAPPDLLPHIDHLLKMSLEDFTYRRAFDDLPDLAGAVRRGAACIELLDLLAANLKTRIESLRTETRPREYAKRELIQNLTMEYEHLHGLKPLFSRVIDSKKMHGERDNLPSGPVLIWLRGLLHRISERSTASDIRDLAAWAQQPDTISGVLRKISAPKPKIKP